MPGLFFSVELRKWTFKEYQLFTVQARNKTICPNLLKQSDSFIWQTHWNWILCLQIFIPANPLLADATWSTELNSRTRSVQFIKFNEPIDRLHKSNCTVLSWLNDPDEPRNIRKTEHNHTSLVLYCSGADIIIIAWRHNHYELSMCSKNCVKILLFLFNREKKTLNKFGAMWRWGNHYWIKILG